MLFTNYRLCKHPSKKYPGETFFTIYVNFHVMEGMNVRVKASRVGNASKGRQWMVEYPKGVFVSTKAKTTILNAIIEFAQNVAKKAA